MSQPWAVLLDAWPLPALLGDASGALRANAAWRRCFGSPAEGVGAAAAELLAAAAPAWEPDALTASAPAETPAESSAEPPAQGGRVVALECADGSVVRFLVQTVALAARAVHGTQGASPAATLLTCTPIEGLLSEREDLFAVACHDLRTPINAMVGWLHVMSAARAPADDLRARAVDGLERAVRQQKSLVETLEEAARSLRGELPLSLADVDLAALAARTIGTVGEAAATRRIELSQAHDGVRPVRCDPHWTARALGLLLEGALRQAGPGTRLQVATGGSAQGPWFAIERARDDGAGASLAQAVLRTLDGRLAVGVLQSEGAVIRTPVENASGAQWRIEVIWPRASNRPRS